MDIKRLRHYLEDTGKRMVDLAERLDKDGEPLDKWEKDLAKAALIPAVKEKLDLVFMEYMTGNTPEILREFDI